MRFNYSSTLRANAMDQAIQTLLDKQAIYELSCRYMRGLDRLDADLAAVGVLGGRLLRVRVY